MRNLHIKTEPTSKKEEPARQDTKNKEKHYKEENNNNHTIRIIIRITNKSQTKITTQRWTGMSPTLMPPSTSTMTSSGEAPSGLVKENTEPLLGTSQCKDQPTRSRRWSTC